MNFKLFFLFFSVMMVSCNLFRGGVEEEGSTDEIRCVVGDKGFRADDVGVPDSCHYSLNSMCQGLDGVDLSKYSVVVIDGWEYDLRSLREVNYEYSNLVIGLWVKCDDLLLEFEGEFFLR